MTIHPAAAAARPTAVSRHLPRASYTRSARQPAAPPTAGAGFGGGRHPAGLEAAMAGKADLVNSIVDSASSDIQAVPENDGWKNGSSAPAAPAPAGSLTLDPFGGGQG
jgi:hypothetical protein